MCAVSCAMAGQETAFWQAHGSSGHESQQILQAIMMTHFTCYPSHWDIQPLPPLKKNGLMQKNLQNSSKLQH